MANHTITITDDRLYSQIVEYCKENNEKIGTFCMKLLRKQFAMEKYGDVPFLKIKDDEKIEITDTDNGPSVIKGEIKFNTSGTSDNGRIYDKQNIEKFISDFTEHKDDKPLGELSHKEREIVKIEAQPRPKKRRL